MGNVYKIANTINGDFYIGCTYKSIEERFQEHLNHALVWKSDIRDNYNSRLYRSIRKYGKENFQIELLLESKNYLKEEAKLIKKMMPSLNLKPGGNGYNQKNKTKFVKSVSEGLKEYWNHLSKKDRIKRGEKVSRGLKKYYKHVDRSGENAGHWGKKHSDETKEKMSLAKLGKKRKITKKVIASYKKISKSLTGYKQSPEHIAKTIAYQSTRTKEPRARKYILYNENKKFSILNLAKFCKENNFPLISFARRLRDGKPIICFKNTKFNGWLIRHE